MQIRPTALTFGLIIYSFITLFYVYTEFGIDSSHSNMHSQIQSPMASVALPIVLSHRDEMPSPIQSMASPIQSNIPFTSFDLCDLTL